MAVFVLLVLAFGARDSGASSELARKLVDLRAEVESAGAAYEEALQKRKAVLDPFLMRHSELEAQVAKEELRSVQLKEKLKATRGTAVSKPTGGQGEWKSLERWSAALSSYVDSGVPFRLKERKERARALEERIRQKRESPVAVASDLWQASEKELQLTRDVEYRIGKLPLPGGEADGEIARLGMAHLLFVDSSGRAGYSRREKGKWELVAAKSSEEKAAVERLVSRLKAKSANGWYEIPGLDSVPWGEEE